MCFSRVATGYSPSVQQFESLVYAKEEFEAGLLQAPAKAWLHRCACVCHCTPVEVRAELAEVGLELSFDYMCLKHQTRVIKLGGKNFYPQSHLTGPIFFRVYKISDEIDLKLKKKTTSHSSFWRLGKHSLFVVLHNN